MATEIVMPKWGLSMQEGLINRWLKREGDRVEQGEPVLEVETEKITNVVEAPAAGILARILYPAGSTVAVTRVLALITAPGEPVPEIAPEAPVAASPAVSAPAAATRPAAAPAPGGIIPATPAARRLARERGLDLAGIRGSGPSGTITREDVERALAEPVAPAVLPVRKVGFYSDGHRLDGLLYSPEGLAAGEPRAGVVLCVGYTYLKTLVMPDIAKALVAAGYVALVFDYRGFGDSAGPRWRLLPEEQVRDVRAALTFVAAEPHVDASRLAVLGLSLGGSNALAAAALDRRVGAAVAIEAMGDGERWLRGLRRYWEWGDFQARLAQDRVARVRTGQSARVDPLDIVLPDPDSRAFLEAAYREYPQMQCDLPLETAEALIEFRPEALVDRIAPRPVCLIHGAADRLVPAEESRRLFARAGEPRRLAIVPGMSHFDWVMPNTPGFRRVTELAVGFLQEVLPPR
ncbi:MAG: alpha/beta fold hydrolase [Candidatus Rokubacteria bacterium]|nr:alpha/beta fold hydrolase [Candidatus Rokubacteria bacterium]